MMPGERKAALACIVCDTPLQMAFSDGWTTNQPSDGIGVSTPGHYGSTVYDSILGDSVLHFSVCDECLVKAAEKEQVLWHHLWRPVYAYMSDGDDAHPVQVGREMLDRPAIPWVPGSGMGHDEGSITVDDVEVGTKMGAIEWTPTAIAYAQARAEA